MRIFSGIQPTGEMHVGNYLGSTLLWLELQEKHECFFCVVDLHAMTVPQDPEELRAATQNKIVELLALGINPEKCTLFVQSQVPEHTELAWILNTLTPLGELERMTQFKDKAKKQKGEVFAGLLNYPVLMASDILLYKTQAVPVGQDQTQHLELTRKLANKFNARFGETFPEHKTLLRKDSSRIMSLQDPKRKMSKSDSKNSYLSLFDEPEVIQQKVASAVTDTGKEVKFDPAKKPGISNLLAMYSLFSNTTPKDLEKKYKGKGYASFKKGLASLLTEKLEPFRKKKKELQSRELYIREIMRQGQEKARSVARLTMEEVREKVGLLNL
jgi:tryptophanyl-tRNA synthetase